MTFSMSNRKQTAGQEPHRLDKTLLRRAFERAAQSYDEAALLQREVGARMLERLDLLRLAPQLILDIGAGTGHASAALARRYKDARVIAIDLAVPMLKQARTHVPLVDKWLGGRQAFVCGDAERLPLRGASADMIFSNLTLQWCDDLDLIFHEFRRVLKPGGLLMFSTFGPDTLKELRGSWSRVDAFSHINTFIDMHDVGDALMRAHFAAPVMDVENFTLTYPSVHKLMRDLKAIGAHNVTAGRAPGLTGKGRLKAMIDAYEAHRADGLLPASYEVVYGHAWTPERAAAGNQEAGITRIPITQIRRPGS